MSRSHLCLLLAAVLLVVQTSLATQHVLNVASSNTLTGSGSDQPYAVLSVKDQANTDDDWYSYKEYTSDFSGMPK